MSANNSKSTDKKEYAKIAIKTRPSRSSSLTLLLQQDRPSCTALTSAGAANLEGTAAENNVATGLNLVFGTWKKEDRIPPLPSRAAIKKSGFETMPAKVIVGKFGAGLVDSGTENERVIGEGDGVVGREKNGVVIPRG